MPAFHFPTACVAYPALLSFAAIVVMLRGMPCTPHGSDALCERMSSFNTLTCIGLRPDWSAHLDGLQYLKACNGVGSADDGWTGPPPR